ncbi:MAG: tetratricopeptide repeat protein [Aureliella sp.]
MSSNAASLIQSAFAVHQAGRLDEAERLYNEILQAFPECIDAWQLLGALMIQQKRYAQAIPLLEKAIECQPGAAGYHSNLALAYFHTDQLDRAVTCYQRSLALQPHNMEAMCRLGAALLKLHRNSEAAHWLQRALELEPSNIGARVNAGTALYRISSHAEAQAHFECVLKNCPDQRQALAGLGQILLKDPKPSPRAVECWERLARIEPQNPAMHNNLATVLKNLKRWEEAEAACHRALELIDNYFPALCNLGLVLSATQRYDEARQVLQRAVDLERLLHAAQPEQTPANAATAPITPGMWKDFGPVAYCQLAALCNILGETEDAKAANDRALDIDNEHADSRMMRAFLNLQAGQYQTAWSDYEYRKNLGEHAPRKLSRPEWTGQPATDKTILIHAEQGLGDSIHFIRYAKLVRARAGRVLFLAQRPLVRLVGSMDAIDQIIPDGEPLPAYDYHVALLSLPGIFQTTVETIPNDVPYLEAEPALVQLWKRRLESIRGFRVGITWQGNRDFAFDHMRSVPLVHFRPIAELAGVQLVSLQKGQGTEQLKDCGFQVHHFEDVDTAHGGFVDTAAIMKNVDLVISSDTATPHLAGALNVPVWLAKSRAAEWRWFADDRASNPWYPSMRMFRQPQPGDWTSVFDQMAAALQQLLQSQSGQRPA